MDRHAPRLADLPRRRDLNAVRAELLDSFVTAMLGTGAGVSRAGSKGRPPVAPLDRFKLAGVIATWWTDTLPDFTTLLENGFPGVIDGWVDAIADAVEDDDHAGPAFDPFGHKLVRAVMADYLDQIAAAKADIARLKGEKEAFEQSNPPADAEEDELANWNYAKDLQRRIKELKAEHREAFKELKKLEKQAVKKKATRSRSSRRESAHSQSQPGEGNQSGLTSAATAEWEAARQALQPVLDQLAALEAELAPYEAIKQQLAEARRRYRTLTGEFVDVLKSRCDALGADQKLCQRHPGRSRRRPLRKTPGTRSLHRKSLGQVSGDADAAPN